VSDWQGWRPLPAPAALEPDGPWVDLSHALHDGLRTIGWFPEARFSRLKSMPADPLNLTEMQIVCHFGTHVDAPSHFIADGPALDEIPLDRLHGSGVVWRMDAEPYGCIGADTLAAMRPAMRDGDIVLLDTGWAVHVGTERYDRASGSTRPTGSSRTARSSSGSTSRPPTSPSTAGRSTSTGPSTIGSCATAFSFRKT
jgi:kynurenine formamidase